MTFYEGATVRTARTCCPTSVSPRRVPIIFNQLISELDDFNEGACAMIRELSGLDTVVIAAYFVAVAALSLWSRFQPEEAPSEGEKADHKCMALPNPPFVSKAMQKNQLWRQSNKPVHPSISLPVVTSRGSLLAALCSLQILVQNTS